MPNELIDIPQKEIAAMKSFLEIEVQDLKDFYPITVRESEFGNTLAARTVIYKVRTNTEQEIYAVDGGFLLDPFTRKFSITGNPQCFKAVYPYAPTEDIADKIHLYFVARICEQQGAVPPGGASQLAKILGVGPEYLFC